MFEYITILKCKNCDNRIYGATAKTRKEKTVIALAKSYGWDVERLSVKNHRRIKALCGACKHLK